MSTAKPRMLVHTADGRTFSRTRFLSLLNTYNCFLKDKTHLQLTVNENPAGHVTLEGFLVVSWGMKRPIRLKIQDEKQIVEWNCSKSQEYSPDPISPLGKKRGMTRWGEFENLYHIDELEETIQDGSETVDSCASDYRQYESQTLRVARHEPVPENSILFRSMSDAALVKKRVKTKGAEERQSNRLHRFSINGHFYNYKTSIFTPSYGTATNVRLNSTMRTQEVISQLLNKFKIENDPSEFALYCIHQSGERKKLGSSDLPLWERFLQGPSEDIMRIFLMDTDEQEVSMDVAQYVNLELPILQRVLRKLHEEESKEIQRVVNKYRREHSLLTQCLNSKLTPKTETTV
ncbi:ras association domain-containing protein 6 isoform X1 [Ictalurus punctatus]|uniref:Ras association domain-containing protein 6 isoform X1 n=2 Tax=Ictalurus punctatus TaxID=7998 RepID=A0A2D0SS20_ICTPU|nr:ras association domain-containing protein 6 isoform X1 [Ictalurus punctatus]XP_047016749.1 ras association domain-containing protein 6 isoform X1 [Ictalurus punctatus]XP_047016750.1 ras association domain-containing protein 6 isoform X1 [Ictalurus punctatus]XP_053542935.1 ras association domain-containing protein 6 isoform X1 [Ictalurus punctatus]